MAGVEDAHGTLDILVKNAGLQHRTPLQDVPRLGEARGHQIEKAVPGRPFAKRQAGR